MPKKISRTSRKILLVGNWKMNPSSPAEALSLYKRTRTKALKVKNVSVVLAVPAIYIQSLAKYAADKKVGIAAQDVYVEEGTGAHTGALSAEMLRKVGAIMTIVGHSERRAMGDSNEDTRRKVRSALKAGLGIILCVGERERDTHGKYLSYIKEQLTEGLRNIDRAFFHKIVIAYEPVWAIGEKALRAATPQDVLEMQIFIRKVLSDMVGGDIARGMQIIYGGSSDQNNAHDILSIGQVDGLLPGRASLNPEVFGEMLAIAQKIVR